MVVIAKIGQPLVAAATAGPATGESSSKKHDLISQTTLVGTDPLLLKAIDAKVSLAREVYPGVKQVVTYAP